MKPPFDITSTSLQLVLEIGQSLGQLQGMRVTVPQPELRKKNRIQTIHSSLAIEGNTLSIPQVTDLINNKTVLGPKKDITEVLNAINAYNQLNQYEALSQDSFLAGHHALMHGLIADAGAYRQVDVGIYRGEQVKHIAPSYARVPHLMEDLFHYLNADHETPMLIKSCVFHYELMFIHPFSDGNGRVGRLWQTLLLMQENALFEYLPVETAIKKEQTDYYRVLETCDQQGNSTLFIEFLLNLLCQSLKELKEALVLEGDTTDRRLQLAREALGDTPFARKAYQQIHKHISSATASRDLKYGLDQGGLKKMGERARTRYVFSR